MAVRDDIEGRFDHDLSTLSYRASLSCDNYFVISSLPTVAYPEELETRNL
jgi:hypothetical protein